MISESLQLSNSDLFESNVLGTNPKTPAPYQQAIEPYSASTDDIRETLRIFGHDVPDLADGQIAVMG